jgi:putative transcriptional regulator
MTQRELAWHLRVSVQAVSKWETGISYPDLTLLLPIARLFSVSLDELFGRTDGYHGQLPTKTA